MSDKLRSQGAALVGGINAFEPFIYQIHADYKAEKLADWPTVVLATTAQSTAVSIFKLLPPVTEKQEILDQRSIASLIRNMVDTHDALAMLVGVDNEDEFNLHRDILGLYISGKINKVQKLIAPNEVQKIYSHTKSWYWKRIQESPLFSERMQRLKNGDSVFYQSRRERVQGVCGDSTDFVLGVLADISSYVHSIPVPLWLGTEGELYSNKCHNQDVVAVWLSIANFYFARSIEIIIEHSGYTKSDDLQEYTHVFRTPFG